MGTVIRGNHDPVVQLIVKWLQIQANPPIGFGTKIDTASAEGRHAGVLDGIIIGLAQLLSKQRIDKYPFAAGAKGPAEWWPAVEEWDVVEKWDVKKLLVRELPDYYDRLETADSTEAKQEASHKLEEVMHDLIEVLVRYTKISIRDGIPEFEGDLELTNVERRHELILRGEIIPTEEDREWLQNEYSRRNSSAAEVNALIRKIV